MLLCVQCTSLPTGLTRRCLAAKFRLVIFGLLSSLSLAGFIARQHWPEIIASFSDSNPGAQAGLVGVLELIQFISALFTAVAFAIIPKRPDVQHNGKLVDQQYTLSLLCMISYSWNRVLWKTEIIEMNHIPGFDYATRSRTLHSRLNELVSGIPL